MASSSALVSSAVCGEGEQSLRKGNEMKYIDDKTNAGMKRHPHALTLQREEAS